MNRTSVIEIFSCQVDKGMRKLGELKQEGQVFPAKLHFALSAAGFTADLGCTAGLGCSGIA